MAIKIIGVPTMTRARADIELFATGTTADIPPEGWQLGYGQLLIETTNVAERAPSQADRSRMFEDSHRIGTVALEGMQHADYWLYHEMDNGWRPHNIVEVATANLIRRLLEQEEGSLGIRISADEGDAAARNLARVLQVAVVSKKAPHASPHTLFKVGTGDFANLANISRELV
jgi:hypothetical protein